MELKVAVYAAARDLADGMFIGTHQFIIIKPDTGLLPNFKTPRNKIISPRDLGNGNFGYVIGAQNRGRLKSEFFEKNDYQATLEYFNPEKYVSWKADFDTEVKLIEHSLSDTDFINRILFMVKNYMINEQEDNIPYPKFGLAVNSNSWVQSLVRAANGSVDHNFKGLDVSNTLRIPSIYFQAICSKDGRPKVNS